MNLALRAVRRSKRLARDIADVQLRKTLQAQARLGRTAAALDVLPQQPVLVVVAHPDDEVIAAAALLARAPRAGVICVSNGAPRKESYARNAGFASWLDYAQARQAEAAAALALLKRPLSPAANLGIADQEIVFNMTALARHLVEPLTSGFSHVVTHAYEGGHPDHDAVAFGVHAACALAAKAGLAAPTIVEAPLYSAPGGQFVHAKFVPHSDAGPEAVFALSPAEQDLKRQMYDRHATQRAVFDDFSVDRESFRVAPRYHFSAPPHAGEVGFDQFKWPLNGKAWRKEAWRAMRELDLADELA